TVFNFIYCFSLFKGTERGFFLVAVFHCVQIKRLDIAGTVFVSHFFIKSLVSLASQPFVLDHGVDEIRQLKKIMLLIIWNSFMKAVRYMHEGIKPHNIHRTECCRFWPSYHWSCKF